VADGADGEVIAVDRFGNIITSIEGAHVPRAAPVVTVAGHAVTRFVKTYGEVAVGGVCALVGSSERLEIAVRNGDAAAALGVAVGAPVQVRAGA
jgi:S-adenosylmethionine hydrolase